MRCLFQNQVPLLNAGEKLIVIKNCTISSLKAEAGLSIYFIRHSGSPRRCSGFKFSYYLNNGVRVDTGDIDTEFDGKTPRLRFPYKNELKEGLKYGDNNK